MKGYSHSATRAFLVSKSPAAIFFLGNLLVLILILPFNEGGNGYVLQDITQVLLLLCFAFWLTQTIRRGTVALTFDRIDLFVLGFVGWSFLSFFVAGYHYAAFLELVKIASYAAVFYLCRILFPLRSIRSLLLFTILGSSILQMSLGWAWYLSQRTPALQADFVNPNNFAGFLSFGVNIGLSFVLFAPFSAARPIRRLSRFFPRILVSLLIGGLGVTILAEQSRGAIISLVGTGFLLVTIRKKRIGVFFLVACCLLLFVPLPGGNLFTHLQKRGDQFAYQRIGIWKSSVRMAADHPLSGVGLGMYSYYGARYNFPVDHGVARYGKKLDAAHNDFLQIAAELGSIGVLLFAGGLIVLGGAWVGQVRQRAPSWSAMAAASGILGLLIQSLFSDRLFSPSLAILSAILGVIVLEESRRFHVNVIRFKASWLWHVVTVLGGMTIFLYGIAYPSLAHVAYLRYDRLMAEQKPVEAVNRLQTALTFVPQNPNYHYLLAMIYQDVFQKIPDEKNFQAAEHSFRQAIHYNPQNYRYYESLAKLYEKKFYVPPRQNRQESIARSALEVYLDARKLNPFNPFILFSMATLHADLDEFGQAIELLHTSVTLEPNFVGGHQMTGKMLVHLGRQDEAEMAFQRAEYILQRYENYRSGSRYVALLLRPL